MFLNLGEEMQITRANLKVAIAVTCVLLAHGSVVAAQPVRNPVVFIHGFAGSQLLDANGDVVFGDARSLVKRFGDVEMSTGEERNPRRQLSPGPLIESVSVFGLFRVEQYSGLISHLTSIGYKLGADLFVFSYDWRQSNFETSRRLHEFVEKTQALKGRKFDLVAHSMGGLVAMIYVSREGQGRVDKLIAMGTPFYGSLNALKTYLDGWGALKNFLAGGRDRVRQVVGTIPALFELMPRYDKCCIVGGPTDNDRKPVDLLQPTTWSSLGWMPSDVLLAKRVEDSLASARSLDELVKKGPPSDVRMFRIAGSRVATAGQVYLASNGTPLVWKEASGDGTVIEQSATAREFSTSFTAIKVHATIFNDDHVKVQLKRILAADELSIEKYGAQAPSVQFSTGADLPVVMRQVSLDLGDTIRAVGDSAVVSVKILDEDGQAIGGVAVIAQILRDGIELQQFRLAQQGDRYTESFKLSEVGSYKVVVRIPGVGPLEDYIVVVEGQ